MINDISKYYVNLLVDNARNNNIDLMAMYYTNNYLFDVVFLFASISFGIGCYNAIIEVLKNEGKRLKKQL